MPIDREGTDAAEHSAAAEPAPGTSPAVGHNGGPPIEEPVDRFIAYAWAAAHREVWKNPPMDVLRFRLARAEAAGVTYREYMLALLDTGRHLQAKPMAAVRPMPSTLDHAKPKRAD